VAWRESVFELELRSDHNNSKYWASNQEL